MNRSLIRRSWPAFFMIGLYGGVQSIPLAEAPADVALSTDTEEPVLVDAVVPDPPGFEVDPEEMDPAAGEVEHDASVSLSSFSELRASTR